MSLVVWLPLTKDLRQQGLSNVTITNNGAVFNSSGKLGGCYSVDNVKQIGCNNCLNLGTTFSIAFWSKINSKNVDWGNIFKIYKDGADYIGMCLAYTTDTNPKLGFHIYRNNGSNAREVVIDGYKEYSLNNWFHTVITVTPTKAIVYKDGEIFNTFTISKSFPSITNYSLWLGKNGIGNGLDCSINDFRLYDHCLSPMEAKELAKGLVLHYPLNRQGWGQENLYTTSQDFSGSWNNKSSWATAEETYQNFIVKQKSTVWGGLSQNIPCSNGDIFTISFYAKVDAGGRICSVHRSSLGNVTTGLTILGGNFISGTDWVNATDDGTQWKRYWATVRIDSSDITYLQWRIENSITNKTLYICGIKMERGSIATPWCPNSSDTLATTMGLNSTTEYDCSGFCNNGTRTGTFTWTSDTPKYAVSTTINSSKIQCITNPITGDDPIFSIGFWFKLKSNISYIAYADLVSFSSSSYSNQPFRLEICGNPVGNDIYWFRGPSGNTGGFKINTSNLVRDTWYYTMLVSEGNKQYSYYINGIKTGTYNGSANSWIPTNIFSIGDGQAGAFDISDVRIYATALSADDVKSLYQNSAYIDSSGNVYGAVHSEV